ncbi:hypothetical protein Amn_24060 [Aminobacter sp. Y103A]|uniref:hypothetical protein n=1 Tax=Aminobacter sp. Y103A TaxID=1870862 RepID=UPI002573E98E|nr:hypothetical protein [Aminobacter sp. SS-2016]BBD37526.1 hypothetical protein Amn_24060 [Aminobacter sp. SS-2016]
MQTEQLPVGRRVTHQSDQRLAGVIVDRSATMRGRQLAVVIVDGQDAPRIFDTAVLIAA